ncbi:putative WPP domain-interacting protein 2-like [Sesbania bispinosa]|nr:putative WPP domain-interacting protein 2-like [Sesbania bispinosa]
MACPLADNQSVCTLAEVQKFREIGIEVVSPDDDSANCSSASAGVTAVDLGLHKSFLSGHSGAEEVKQTASSSLELKLLSLTQNINILESKLEELQGMLALKDSRIAELETTLSSGKFPKEESASTIGLSEEKCKEEESELEGLFRQRIEAEVEFLAITKVMQNLKAGADFQRTLLEEQEKLSENQAQVLNKVVDAESKASVLKNKAEELEKYYGDSLVLEESFVLQKRMFIAQFWGRCTHISLQN